jgi:hypothetical protein
MDTEIIAFDTLMNEATTALGEFAGDKWTDFNIHDPGVTILEYLAYALHDVSFRANLPVGDMVASATDRNGMRQFLPPPNKCLEAPIVTDNDIRALVMDLHFVRNVWIEARNDGLKDITIDVSATLGARQRRWLRQAVREVIVRHRMIGTDVGAISFLERLPIEVDLTLEVSEHISDLEQFLYQLFLKIDDYIMALPIMPDVRNFDFPNNSTFGPQLIHGYYDEASLIASERKDKLDINGLIKVIEKTESFGLPDTALQVRGLKASRVKKQSREGVFSQVNDMVRSGLSDLDLDTDCAYELNLESSRLLLQQGETVLSPDLSSTFAEIRRIRNQKSLDKKLVDVKIPSAGVAREDLSYYRSVQTEFPSLYSLKKGELTKSATKAERAHAKQLQGFILLFEQFIANAIARIQSSPALLGVSSLTSPTAGLVEKIDFHAGLEGLNSKLREKSQVLFDNGFDNRRLACDWRRFAANIFGEADRFEDIYALNVTAQEKYLGWNYHICPEGGRSLLWLETYLRKYLINTDQTTPHDPGSVNVTVQCNSKTTGAPEQYQFLLELEKGNGSLIGQTLFKDAETAQREGDRALSLAASRHRHRIVPQKVHHEPGYLHELLDAYGNVIARSVDAYERVTILERDVDAWVKAGKNSGTSQKAFVVDHILLRPAQEMTMQELPPACMNQISIILPSSRRYWKDNLNINKVLSDLEGRLPAHILANILWLNDEDLEEFEEAYSAWIDDYWGGGPALSYTRDQLISLLESYGLSGWSERDAFSASGGQYDV